MPERTFHVIQVFERRDGALVTGTQEVTTPVAATQRARMLAKRFAGAVVMQLHDSADGSRHEAIYLSAFGEVPEPYVEAKVEE